MPVLTTISDETERRFIEQVVEVRGGGGQMRVGGKAAVFNKRSQPLAGFTEIVTPTFFDHSRSNGFANVICRFNHNDLMLLGATNSGTLRLAVDSVGLDYEVDLPECRADVWELVQRRDIQHSSFAFQVTDEESKPSDGGYPVRMLLSGRRIDVAPVAIPAYPDATVALRSFARQFGAPVEDVVEYQQRDQLRKFLPSGGSRKRPLTRHQRETQLMGMVWETPPTPQQEAVERMRRKSSREKQLETYAMDPDWCQWWKD
jgi:HK97 family phage prohead protease